MEVSHAKVADIKYEKMVNPNDANVISILNKWLTAHGDYKNGDCIRLSPKESVKSTHHVYLIYDDKIVYTNNLLDNVLKYCNALEDFSLRYWNEIFTDTNVSINLTTYIEEIAKNITIKNLPQYMLIITSFHNEHHKSCEEVKDKNY
jgi:hypothetical protein